MRLLGQDGALPAARAERRDGRERQQGRADGQNGAVGGEIIGRGARRGGNDDAVADELFHAHLAVYDDAQLGGLMGLAEEGHLVEGEGLMIVALHILGQHAQGVNLRHLGAAQALQKIVRRIIVHEKADGAAVHAEDGLPGAEDPVHGVQDQAVAAEGDDHVGFLFRHVRIALFQFFERLLRLLAVGGDEGDARPVFGPVVAVAAFCAVLPGLVHEPVSG